MAHFVLTVLITLEAVGGDRGPIRADPTDGARRPETGGKPDPKDGGTDRGIRSGITPVPWPVLTVTADISSTRIGRGCVRRVGTPHQPEWATDEADSGGFLTARLGGACVWGRDPSGPLVPGGS